MVSTSSPFFDYFRIMLKNVWQKNIFLFGNDSLCHSLKEILELLSRYDLWAKGEVG